ncbi:peptidase inhibitor family I36 protein [Kribbella sp. NPDC056345]|uniref:peptidase inhibitor family I36 protein n=1 Tax=Kribbella sp. NPDC056345 TaxID=3345789 RepID=UPI0035DF6333
MMVRLTAAKTAAFTTLAVLGILVPTTSAQAATTDLGDCPRSHFCAWADDNYKGTLASWEGDDSWWGDNNMHDDAESMFNNGTPASEDVVAIYYDVNHGGFAFCMDRGETIDVNMDDNDYDSHVWTSGC